ncbi:hypothetical protein [Prevotella melaninogenica]|nr:hypothetical protein [Prevotella melaninogenica]
MVNPYHRNTVSPPQEYHQPTDKHYRNTKLEGIAPAVLIGSVQ